VPLPNQSVGLDLIAIADEVLNRAYSESEKVEERRKPLVVPMFVDDRQMTNIGKQR
jgi:hypothetical protein